MCLYPLHIKQNATYKDGIIHPFRNEVPCGKCHECAESVRMEWLTRMSFELHSLIRRGGTGVFLTFTYNASHIPYYTDGDFTCRCFSHKDIKTFLNRLKIHAYRRWGKYSYRYFWVSEYGKQTQRPHYHAEFLLANRVDYKEFIELCRELWSSKKYGNHGFMFPKYDKKRGCYVDNKKRVYEPRIRNLCDSARYVSKYVTKDMSFYGLPKISEYLRDKRNKWKMREYLPKHYQSNGLGYCIIDYIDINDDVAFRRALDVGIYNPVLGKLSPFPKYLINKLMYKNVRTDKVGHVRKSFRNGNILYDRELTSFGREYQKQIFESHVKKYSIKMSTVFQQLRNDKDPLYDSVIPIFNKDSIDVNNPQHFEKFAVFHEVYKHCTDATVSDLLSLSSGDLSVLKDKAFDIWLQRRDVAYLRELRYSCLHVDLKPEFKISYPLFAVYYDVDRIFAHASSIYSSNKLKEREKLENRIKEVREKYRSRFDTNLC